MNEPTYTKPWDPCPECGGSTTLYQEPSQYAGIWECQACGVSDSCEHESTHTESFTVDTMRNGEHDQYEAPGQVCDDCGVAIEE